MPKEKTKPKSLPPIRVSEKLFNETEQARTLEQESTTEYIRKAVEERNKKVLKKK